MLSNLAVSVCSNTSRYSVCILDWCRPIYQLLTTGYIVSPNASRNSTAARSICKYPRFTFFLPDMTLPRKDFPGQYNLLEFLPVT